MLAVLLKPLLVAFRPCPDVRAPAARCFLG